MQPAFNKANFSFNPNPLNNPPEKQNVDDKINARIDECCKQISDLGKKIDDAVSGLNKQMERMTDLLMCLNNEGAGHIWMFTFPPYEGKDDVRSPVDFIREFEGNVHTGVTEVVQAKIFRYVLSKSSVTSWVRLMDDPSPYSAMKKEFLNRHWDAAAQTDVITDFLSYDLRLHRPENFNDYFRSWKRKLQAAIKTDAIIPALIKIFEDNAPEVVQSKLAEKKPKTFDEIESIVEKMPHEDLMYLNTYPPLKTKQELYSKLFTYAYIMP